MTAEQVIKYYNQCESISETGRHFCVSEQKIRRILISAGVYETAQTQEVASLYNSGYTPKEIGAQLRLSNSAVFANLPYSKGQYLSDAPSKNAIRIRECRNRKATKEKVDNDIDIP